MLYAVVSSSEILLAVFLMGEQAQEYANKIDATVVAIDPFDTSSEVLYGHDIAATSLWHGFRDIKERKLSEEDQ